MLLIPFAVIIILFIVITIVDTSYKNNDEQNSEFQSNETQYNPATGLPMIGALDSMGNSMGSSASDRSDYWNHDYHHSTFNSSSYDPFNNRY